MKDLSYTGDVSDAPTTRDDLLRAAWRGIADVVFSPEQHDRMHAAATSVGLPHPGAAKALLSIDEAHPPSMRELAGELKCDASYITALVDSLERPGYVERVVHPADRRVKLLRITPLGQQVRRQLRDAISEPPRALSRLSDRELTSLARITRKLSDPDEPVAKATP